MKVFDDEKDLLLDHDYDGIKELDNHMPVWWLWLFYFTIAWGVGYLTYYYIFDGPNQHEEYEMEMAAAQEKYNLSPENGEGGEPVAEQFSWAFLDDEERIAEGREIFMGTGNLCFTCHGSNGEGLVGPNLTDELWIHGCSAEEVASSIINGYPDRGMIAYGSGSRMPNEKVQSLISYIASIQGSEPANPKAPDPRAQPCTIE
ncbi:cbb3-type cytochrome c oxidase N-terminal domain-containing protein [Gracilimonas tropica]|uniref:cbb3-type cytochrome c oxidase N-terminal domain-containing protein n=1 Tax=Gracilimonas tropica TaxID=454600 RepID=UPI00037F9449|nr:cbb3-type cytochrome c oxidase N-terminal domain-containing protein [Gracilimonas tropica]